MMPSPTQSTRLTSLSLLRAPGGLSSVSSFPLKNYIVANSCIAAFVNLAAYAKFVVAIEMSKALYKEEYSHKVLLERWHSVLDLPVLKDFRPTLSAFRLYYSFMGKAHRTKVSSKKPSFDVTAAANVAVFGADLPPDIDEDNEVLQGYRWETY
jgi:hypothetical protein